MSKSIGPSFYDELLSDNLVGLPFSWNAEGALLFGDAMTPDQIASVQAVYENHNPLSPSWSQYKESAMRALDQSDVTVTRCYENGVQVPSEWASYRKSIRDIVSATTGDATKPLPTKPAYPTGT